MEHLKKCKIVLERLFGGETIKHGNWEMVLCDDNELCFEITKFEDPDAVPVYIRSDISLKKFLDYCDNLSNEDAALYLAENKVAEEHSLE